MLRKKIFYITIIPLLSYVVCVFDTEDNSPLIMSRVDNETDTVSLWPQLIFEFSVPLKDSIVNIDITPDPGPVYSAYLNDKKDTLIFSVTGSLEGATLYVLTLEQPLTAKNGNILYPEDAVFNIVTLPGEKEPNNKKENADTLLSVCLGAAKPANDTDCFYIFNPTATNVYLKNHDKKSGFVIKDNADNIITINNSSVNDIKVFDISSYNSAPLFVFVFSLFDSDARYELGLTP